MIMSNDNIRYAKKIDFSVKYNKKLWKTKQYVRYSTLSFFISKN